MNGYSEDVRVDKVIRNGGELLVDLPGERSFLRQIDMQYSSNFGFSFGSGGLRVQQAAVTVYGERVRRPPPPVWRELDTQAFNISDGRVVLQTSRADGRVSKIKIRNGVELVIVRGLEVRFRNGDVQRVRMERFFEANEESDIIDLEGDARGIDTVTIDFQPRRRSARNEMQLSGLVQPRVPEPPPGPVGGAAFREVDRQSFLTSESRVVLSPARGASQLGQIRLKVGREAINLQAIEIMFRNGTTQRVSVNRRLDAGEETQVIDLDGDRRFVTSVTLELDPRRQQRQTEVTLLGSELPGRPAPDPYLARGLMFLGEQTVGFSTDRDIVNVPQSEEGLRRRYRVLHFVTERNDVHFISVTLHFANGYTEDYAINKTVAPGTDIPIELRGERAFIKQIEMVYRANPSFRGQAVVKVYAELARR
jgi:hypothetical protein